MYVWSYYSMFSHLWLHYYWALYIMMPCGKTMFLCISGRPLPSMNRLKGVRARIDLPRIRTPPSGREGQTLMTWMMNV